VFRLIGDINMSFIKDAILEAVESKQFKVQEVGAAASTSIRLNIERLYTEKRSPKPLWERLADDASKHDPEGWRAIGDYPYENTVTIFFDEENEGTMYSLDSCKDVVNLISECPGFVFYVTNSDCSFLLCHNDHDYLIGTGEAKGWVGEM